MPKPGELLTLGAGVFGLMLGLAALSLLVVTNGAAGGCTGPAVKRCDYVEAAWRATSDPQGPGFAPHLGYEVFDRGSSVVVQQPWPPEDSGFIYEGISVVVDKRSCRPCSIGWAYPTYGHPEDASPGRLLYRAPPRDVGSASPKAS